MPKKSDIKWLELKSFESVDDGINFLSSKLPKNSKRSTDHQFCHFSGALNEHQLDVEKRYCSFCKVDGVKCTVLYRFFKCSTCNKSRLFYSASSEHADKSLASPATSILLPEDQVINEAAYNDGLHPKLKEYIRELNAKNIHRITPKQIHIHLYEPVQMSTIMIGVPMPNIVQIFT